MKYNRVLLKLSGESLAGKLGNGIDQTVLNDFAQEISTLHKYGCQTAIVLGGGNIFRGLQGSSKGFDRVQGDYMGMLATIINSLALQEALDKISIKAIVLSGIEVNPVCERMSRRKAIGMLEDGYVVIIAGGSGNPYFTTDSAAALRAVEIKADVLLKGTRVDGVYNADPEKDPKATKFDHLSFSEAYEKKLHIMDLTAFTLCEENKMPVIVFDMNCHNNLERIIKGEPIGTLIE